MSGVKIIRALLLAHAPVSALVQPGVIVAGVVPQSAALPAIGVTEVSRTELRTASLAQPQSLVTERVQVTVFSKSYQEQKAILQAARLDRGPQTGVIAGISVLAVLRDIVGPDLSDEDAGICQQSRDFIVKYVENN